MRRLTIAGFIAAAIIAAACGAGGADDGATNVGNTGGNATEAAPRKTNAVTAKIGDTIAVRANGVESEWTVSKAERRDADQYGQTPDNDGVWVNIRAQVKMVKGQSYVWIGSDLSLVTSKGRVYEPTCCPAFKSRPASQASDLSAGQSTDGWVSFAVPAAELKGARIQVKQPSLLDDTVFGYWTLPSLAAK